MGSAAIFIWGIMVGSWITSLWVMQKKPDGPDVARTIIDGLYGKIVLAHKVAPDLQLKATQTISCNDVLHRITLERVDG